MATQNLEIIISSTVSDAVKGLDQVGKGSDKMAKDTERATASVSKSYAQINAASKQLAASNQKLSNSVVNAGGTLTSFSRIVQDAPFGIIGVGNNITAFAEQFQYLQRATGSAGSALKALGQSLLGAGGITLGISLLVTGITQLTQNYGSLDNAINAILFPLNQQARIQKEVNDVLRDGAKAGQEEAVQLDKLYRSATNVNVPLADRNRIVDELQKKYPSYFGNLSNEAILAGNAASQYNRLRDAILAAATTRAIDDKLAEQGSKRVDALIRENEIRKDLAAAVSEQARAQGALDKLLSQTGAKSKGFVDQQDRLTERVASAAREVATLTKELRENGSSFSEIGQTEEELIKIQQQLISQYGAVAAGITTVATATKEAKKAFEELQLVQLNTRQDIFQRPQPIKFQQPVDIQLVGLAAATERAQQQIGEFKQGVVTNLQEVDIDVQRILQQGAATIATGLGNAIGALVSGAGGLQNAFNALIGVFADFLSQIGQSLIARVGPPTTPPPVANDGVFLRADLTAAPAAVASMPAAIAV